MPRSWVLEKSPLLMASRKGRRTLRPPRCPGRRRAGCCRASGPSQPCVPAGARSPEQQGAVGWAAEAKWASARTCGGRRAPASGRG
eukprot:12705349-Alexandrium_andersonii.AAC.1